MAKYTNEKCPDCNKKLKEMTVVIPNDYGGARIVGKQKFCSSMACPYEGPITRIENGN